MNKKEEIIRYTTELLSEKGYQLTILEVANKVNLKPSSIYSHFQSKDKLIEKVVATEADNYYKFLNTQVKLLEDNLQSNFKETLEKCFWNILGYFNNKDDKLRFWRQVSLIENNGLKEKCKGAFLGHEFIYSKFLMDIYNKAANLNHIDKSFHEGHIFLFATMIHGLLNSLLLCNDLIDLHLFATKTWNAYWDSISVKS